MKKKNLVNVEKVLRVGIYVRVSTDDQAREGFSIPAQRERLREFCKSQGWEIVEEYIEDGWSAKDLERPKIKKMLKDIEKSKIDVVLVYKLDRLTRSVLDLYKLLDLFNAHGVAFRSSTEVYDTTTAMGELFLTLVAALAQWERKNLAERVKFGIHQMIDEGKKPGGHNLYGYQFDKNFNCHVVEDEAKIVRMIFDMYVEGFGYRTIANRLNELGIKPKRRKSWVEQTIRSMLLNDMYIGTYRWGEKMIKENHPAIISKSLFRKVQETMEKREVTRERIGRFPLTGILRCGNCDGYPINGSYDKRDDKTYYRCLSCNRLTPETKITPALLLEIEKLITSKSYFLSKIKKHQETSSASEVDVKKVKKELERIIAQREKWYDVFMDEKNPIPKDDLFRRINELNDRETELTALLEDEVEEAANVAHEKLAQIKDFQKQFYLADDTMKKRLLMSIFESVYIYREKGNYKPVSIEYTLK